MAFHRFKGSHIVALYLTLSILLINFTFPPKQILSWDVFGYYLYLPQTVIAGDIRMRDGSFAEDLRLRSGASGSLYQAFELPNGNRVMKYSMGMAVLYTPGFFAGHAIAGLTGAPQDGISPPYLHAMWVWCMLVSIAGIWFWRAVLVQFFDAGMASLAMVLIVFGTHYLLNVTTSGLGAMSHNFLFTGYAILLWLTARWHASPTLRRIIPLACTAGLMILARPSESVCLLFPLLWPVAEAPGVLGKLRWMGRHWRQIVLFAGILILIGVPQFIYWKAVTGHWIYTGYGNDAGEGFNWTRPYTWEVLFGYRKGWFVYTPLMLLAFAGMVPFYRRYRGLFWVITLYSITNVYWVSAWSCYWYSWCFGQRALIPAMAVMALPLAALLEHLWHSPRLRDRLAFGGVGIVALLCVALNLFQSRQFSMTVLNGHLMTKEYYWATFLKNYATPEDKELLLIDHTPENTVRIPYPERYSSRPFHQDHFDVAAEQDKSPHPFRYPGTYRLYPAHTDLRPLDCRHIDLTYRDHCYVRLRVRARTNVSDSAAAPASLQFITNQYFTHGGVYNYRVRDIPLKHGEWNDLDIYQLTPEVRMKEDVMRLYFRYKGTDTVYLDDLQLDVYERTR